MNNKAQKRPGNSRQLNLNLAIVGGDETGRFFLDFFRRIPLPHVEVNILGVCDPNPQAPGLQLARNLGIFTTEDYRRILELADLDGVLELTNSQDVLLELMRLRPEGVWILEHGVSSLFQNLLLLMRDLGWKDREVALEKTVSKFLMQQAHERIVVLEPDFKITDVSEGYLKAVNKSKEEVIGGHCHKIAHGLSSPCAQCLPEMGCPLVETLRTGQSAHVIHEHVMDSGRRMYCDLETYPVRTNENGEIVRVIEIWRDITEQLSSRWETRLRELRTDLEKLVQEDRLISLGKLAASCAHEINNPIQGLLTFCNLMQSMLTKGKPTPQDLGEFNHYLGLMSGELERCGRIVSGLLSFARESRMEASELELKEVIQSVLSLTRHKMELQDIALVLDCAEEPVLIRGDVNQLQQCLLNLIFNAIEAMPHGGDLKVTLKPDDAAKEARIIIEDSGCGIPEKYVDKIFDPFFTTKEEGEGTGLGLSIVYGIVKHHNGRIEVHSREGEGTSFSLHFPLADR
jgi:two-component system, NtrC family, sensor kinase